MNDTATTAAPCPADPASPSRPIADPRTTAEIVYDVVTVLALLVGGFVVPVAGWIAGVVLLWNGPRWSLGWRWLGTLVWPLAIVLPFASAALPWRGAFWLGAGLTLPLLTVVFVLLSRAARR